MQKTRDLVKQEVFARTASRRCSRVMDQRLRFGAAAERSAELTHIVENVCQRVRRE